MPYYFSFQYSAIQKTVFRHDRLWASAGMSQLLAWINEIQMPAIAHKGDVLVAGGGKFTARFAGENDAELARQKVKRLVATSLPMIEFQCSHKVIEAKDLATAKEKGLVLDLLNQKNRLRGYGISYPPYMQVCEECGEYPIEKDLRRREEKISVCRICHQAFTTRPNLNPHSGSHLTSMERIYQRYLNLLDPGTRNKHHRKTPLIPLDFERLFPPADKVEKVDAQERRRMAVWLSDTNNMNGKVPIWFDQPEDIIPKIFDKLKEVNIEIVAGALADVFKRKTWIRHESGEYLPFRLIVAGGDDLCLVFAEKYAIPFAQALSKNFRERIEKIDHDDSKDISRCLSLSWLRENSQSGRDPGSYSFGGAFVVTPLHTPFRAIHELGETLVGEAKERSGRKANSLHWRILSLDEEATVEGKIPFEKPVFIERGAETHNELAHHLSLSDYEALRRFYRSPRLSLSQIRLIASVLLSHPLDPEGAERELIRMAAAGTEKGLQYLLADEELHQNGVLDDGLKIGRVGTLLELLTLQNEGEE